MDRQMVQSKWAEAGSLVESIAEAEKAQARIAVMAALLRDIKVPSAAEPDSGAPVELPGTPPKITTIRQLARYSKRKGVTGHDSVTLLAWLLKQSGRPITSKDCRDNWLALTGSSAFSQTILLRAEERLWIEPLQGAKGQSWALTGLGLNVALKLMADMVEPAKA